MLNSTAGFVKISDDVIDSKELVGGSCTFVSNVADIQSGTLSIEEGSIQDSSSLLGVPSYSIGEMVGVVLEDGMFGQTKVTKGTYFACVPGALYVKELKLPKKVFKNTIYHKLDNRLLDLEWIPTVQQDVIVAPSIISRNGQYELAGKYDPNNISEVEVTWDGVEYICAAEYTPDWFGAGPALTFGNFSFDNGNEEDDTGEPFLITLLSDTNGNILVGGMMGEDDDTHIFSVKTKKTYEKIPEHYLPDNLLTEDTWNMAFDTVENEGRLLLDSVLIKTDDSLSGVYRSTMFNLEEGKKYRAILDHGEYVTIGKAITYEGISGIYIGNSGLVLGEEYNTGEPFMCFSGPIRETVNFLCVDTEQSSNIKIYEMESLKVRPEVLPSGGFGYIEDNEVVLPEIGLEFQKDTNNSLEALGIVHGDYLLNPNYDYSIVFNGTAYPVTVTENIYNGALYQTLHSDESPISALASYSYAEGIGIVFSIDAGKAGYHTVSIVRNVNTVHKIDPKFLPTGGVGYSIEEDNVTVEWDGDTTGKTGFLADSLHIYYRVADAIDITKLTAVEFSLIGASSSSTSLRSISMEVTNEASEGVAYQSVKTIAPVYGERIALLNLPQDTKLTILVNSTNTQVTVPAGVYLHRDAYDGSIYTSKVICGTNEIISKIDEKYLSDDISKKTDIIEHNTSAEAHTDIRLLIKGIQDSLNIDYNTFLAFNTSEIVFDTASTTSALGRALLGRMILS